MTQTLLLDTNVVSYFLQAGREKELAASAGRVAMAIVDEVRDELAKDKARGGAAFTRWLASSNIGARSIVVGGEASATLSQLIVSTAPDKDLGERASIALAASDPSLILVTHDRNGTWIAIREIWRDGARLMGIAPFVRKLFDCSALTDPDIADEVIASAGPPQQRPTWWASWRASMAPAASS